jgi:hypothetical protein
LTLDLPEASSSRDLRDGGACLDATVDVSANIVTEPGLRAILSIHRSVSDVSRALRRPLCQ